MTTREICRDDILGRFPGHSFAEAADRSVTRVELKDGEGRTIAESKAVDVGDAYALIRTNVVGPPDILPRLTSAQRDDLTDTAEGTTIFNTTTEIGECLSDAGWCPADPTYTVSTLPPVGSGGSMIFVTDEAGGATMAFSDGTSWRRVQDRSVVS